VKTSFEIAITTKNIISGFSACGNWPVNTNIFTEQDFLPSQVTDRPLSNSETDVTLVQKIPLELTEIDIPSTSTSVQVTDYQQSCDG